MHENELNRQLNEMIDYWLPKSDVIGALLVKNHQRYIAGAKAVLDYPNVERFLDWGCGAPVLTALLSKHIPNCYAFEPYSSDSQRAFAEHYSIEILEEYPENELFDAITMIEVIEHLPIISDVLPKVVKCLAPGGHLVVTTPNGLRIGLWLQYLLRRRAHPVALKQFLATTNLPQYHHREFTPEELRETLEHFSLRVDELLVTDISPKDSDLQRSRKIAGKAYKPKSLFGKLRKKLAFGSLKPSLVCRATLPAKAID